MAVTKKIVYSGDKFREYLNRHKITYQEASLQLGIDKNTIGKAVRGGKSETLSDKNSGGYPASVSLSDLSKTVPFVAEEVAGYIVKNGVTPEIEALILSKDKEISLLKEMNNLYKERLDLYQKKLFSI